MNEGIHLDLDTWIVPGQIRKANLCRGLGNRYTPAGTEVVISAVAHNTPPPSIDMPGPNYFIIPLCPPPTTTTRACPIPPRLTSLIARRCLISSSELFTAME